MSDECDVTSLSSEALAPELAAAESPSGPQAAAWALRLPPRDKLLAAIIFACAIAPVGTLAFAGVATACALLLAGAARPGFARISKPLARVNAFFLLLLVTMPLRISAAPLPDTFVALGNAQWGTAGLLAALLAILKGNAILLFFLALPGSATLSQNCKALRELHLPEKLVTLLQLVLRHAVTFSREVQALRTAAALRGFVPRFNLHTYRTMAYLAGMLFVRSYDKSLRVEKAMRLRGFSGKFPLLLPQEEAVSASGLPFVMLCAATAVLLLAGDMLHAADVL